MKLFTRGTNQYEKRILGIRQRTMVDVLFISVITLWIGAIGHEYQNSRVMSPIVEGGVRTIFAQEYVTPTPTKAVTPSPTAIPSPTPTIAVSLTEREQVKQKVIDRLTRIYGDQHHDAIVNLLMGESGFNHRARNPNGGACGLFQPWPCEKMRCELEDVECQITWGVWYITSRYGNPTKAYQFWLERHPINGKDVGHWY